MTEVTKKNLRTVKREIEDLFTSYGWNFEEVNMNEEEIYFHIDEETCFTVRIGDELGENELVRPSNGVRMILTSSTLSFSENNNIFCEIAKSGNVEYYL